MIATSTPELERMRQNKDGKKQKLNAAKNLQLTKGTADEGKTSSEEDIQMELIDTDDDLDSISEDDDDNVLLAFQLGSPNLDNIVIGQYVIVKFKEEKCGKLVHYVGKVLSMPSEEGDYEIDFLRYLKTSKKFVYPQVRDIHPVSSSEIEAVLPNPMSLGSTSRTKNSLSFPVDFDLMNICIR